MIEIKVIINGREVSPRNLKDAFQAAAAEAIQEQVNQKLRNVRCREHHQLPRVTASGSSVERLKFTVQGCCQRLIDAATAALK